jgi:hypothetical protein
VPQIIYLNCIEDYLVAYHLKIVLLDKRVGGKRVCACNNVLVKQIEDMRTYINAGMAKVGDVWQ